MNPRFIRLLALIVIALFSVAGCGGDDDSSADGQAPTVAPPPDGAEDEESEASGDSPGNDGSNQVRGISEDTVRLGVLASLTSPQGPPFPGFDDGVRARIERANLEGGVNGRTIELAEVYDDGQDPAANLDLARAAVERDDIFALSVVSTAFLPQTSDYLAAEAVPFVGWGFMPGFCDNDYGFGFNGCLVSTELANTSLILPLVEGLDLDPEGLKWAIISGDDQIGDDSVRSAGFVITDLGGELVYAESSVPQGQPVTDYSPYIQDILASDPDVVLLSINFGDAVPLAGGLNASGYDGRILTYSGYIPGLLEASPDVASALDGSYVIPQFPPQESGVPAIEQMLADLEEIGAEPFISLGVASGYWSADLFVAMLEAAGPDVTGESFAQLANDGFSYQSPLEGSLGEIVFPRDKSVAVPCASLVQVEGTSYVPLLPVTCYDNVEIDS